MEVLKKNESKGIQTFNITNKVNKKFKNKRKLNDLFINTQKGEHFYRNNLFRNNTTEEEKNHINNLFKCNTTERKKNYNNNSLKKFDERNKGKLNKIFTTEFGDKNNIMNIRNNYSINVRRVREKINKNTNTKKYYISPPHKNNNTQMFNTLMDMCHNLYKTKNPDNNIRMKLREDILHNVDNYLFSNLKKNILCPEIIDKKKKKFNIIIPNIKTRKKIQSMDFNKKYLSKDLKKDYDESYLKNSNTNNLRIITYGNYAKKK